MCSCSCENPIWATIQTCIAPLVLQLSCLLDIHLSGLGTSERPRSLNPFCCLCF